MNNIRDIDIITLEEIFKRYPLYSQEGKKEHNVILEIFIPNQDIYWLITEGSIEEDDFIMFGYCKIQCGELGHVSFNELLSIKFDIEYNIHKIPVKLSKLKKKYELY